MTAARPVALSLFPDVKPDRPTGPLLGSVIAGTNADLIAAVAPLYLDGHTVMDVTYGRSAWWRRYRPDSLTAHDLGLDGVDFRALPEAARSVDVVCFDPPYVPQGGPATDAAAFSFRSRYGIERTTTYGHEHELADLVTAGLTECARVARRWLLVKCMEFTSSRRFHDMAHVVKNHAAGLGLDLHDVIVHHTGPGPGGHNITHPIRARRHHSYLLVFDAASHTPPEAHTRTRDRSPAPLTPSRPGERLRTPHSARFGRGGRVDGRPQRQRGPDAAP